jgi:hypothetical protein
MLAPSVVLPAGEAAIVGMSIPGGVCRYTPGMFDALRLWTSRQWAIATASGVVIAILVALPTAVIPNPVFGRAIEVTWWSYPTVILTGVLGGLLIGTYVRTPGAASESADAPLKLGTAGGLISFFAVGCPVCNKLVLLALGTSGAMSWFAPLQPILALASIVILGWALRMRLRGAVACEVAPRA